MPDKPIQPDAEGVILKKEDIATQFLVVRTKDGRVVVQFPELNMGPGAPRMVDVPEAIELIAAGLQTLAQIERQSSPLPPPEKPRITVVPALPPKFRVKE